jgi:hypothetical protein
MELLQLQRCCMCLEAHAALEDVCQWPRVRRGVFNREEETWCASSSNVIRLATLPSQKKKRLVLCLPKAEAEGSAEANSRSEDG